MSQATINSDLLSISSQSQESEPRCRFSGLRGVRWRINLGILPSFDATTDDLRRVAADSRRRYVSLRRRIIVDPHFSKDGNESTNHVMDNPLSQNPDSVWSRFFHNVELERMLDKDLSRLYPEEGSYFQTSTCQSMLRRILLFWCLLHPNYGYRQGMHELLAPLLYVLHIDVQHQHEVRGQYADHFNDDFNGASFLDSDFLSKHRFRKNRNVSAKGNNGVLLSHTADKLSSLDELDPETRDIFLISDVYGAEGELGVIASEKFMEHDAYCLFDNLMNGGNGVVAMAELFSPTPSARAVMGMSPIIEASSAMCHLLFIVDPSLHSHLSELGVETQYFALRWLRLLFGREFSLENLFLLWDEIFSSPNDLCFPEGTNDIDLNCRILSSPRGAFILAMAVSMLVYLRYSLLGTEHATSCLQRLLNFPADINIKNLIRKAKSLQAVALNSGFSMCSHVQKSKNKHLLRRQHSLSFDSSTTALNPLTDRYWEERWKVTYATEESDVNNGSGTSTTMAKTPFIHGPNVTKLAPSKLKNGDNDQSDSPAIHKNDQDKFDVATSLSLTSKLSIQKDRSTGQSDQYIFRRSLSLAEKRDLATNPLSTTATPRNRTYDNELNLDNNNNDVNDIKIGKGTHSLGKQAADKKPPSGKFNWFRKFTRSLSEKNAEKARDVKPTGSSISGKPNIDKSSASTSGGVCNICGENEDRAVEGKNISETIRSCGKSLLHNIQVIESILKREKDAENSASTSTMNMKGEQEIAVLNALMELQKIGDLLSEM